MWMAQNNAVPEACDCAKKWVTIGLKGDGMNYNCQGIRGAAILLQPLEEWRRGKLVAPQRQWLLVLVTRIKEMSISFLIYIGPVHKRSESRFESCLDHDSPSDLVRDLNYMHSQALQPPSRSQTGSAHCEVMGLFTMEWTTFQKSFTFTSPQNQAF